jgi:hypothetical protein
VNLECIIELHNERVLISALQNVELRPGLFDHSVNTRPSQMIRAELIPPQLVRRGHALFIHLPISIICLRGQIAQLVLDDC